jgi:hypothetical protein
VKVIMSNGKNAGRPQLFAGWKEIANHLGKGVRTVQRYEREMGLPVRRPAGKPRGSVIATQAEIDAWVAASPLREAFRLSRLAINSPASLSTEIKNGVEEMHRLRQQTVALRSEVKTTLHLLVASIEGLRDEITTNQRREATASLTSDLTAETGFRPENGFSLLTAGTGQRKAS